LSHGATAREVVLALTNTSSLGTGEEPHASVLHLHDVVEVREVVGREVEELFALASHGAKPSVSPGCSLRYSVRRRNSLGNITASRSSAAWR
jgi:hypothetical protein